MIELDDVERREMLNLRNNYESECNARMNAEARLRTVIEKWSPVANRLAGGDSNAENLGSPMDYVIELQNENEGLTKRLRTVIEERDTLLRQRSEYNSAFSSYRRVRDAQASPEPKTSKQVEHEFKLKSLSLTTPSECAICGLPWSRHGGRDER